MPLWCMETNGKRPGARGWNPPLSIFFVVPVAIAWSFIHGRTGILSTRPIVRESVCLCANHKNCVSLRYVVFGYFISTRCFHGLCCV